MPKMDGYDATRRLRELNVKTPIVAMTAHTLSGDREKCLDAGMDDYLTKPIAIAKLTACLDQWLTCTADPAKQAIVPSVLEAKRQDPDVVFNHDAFLKLMMDDAELAKTLMQMFLANMPGDLEKLKDAIASGDSSAVRLAAHFIKGASANMCARAINATALEIEQAGLNSNIGRAIELIPKLDTNWLDFVAHARVVELDKGRA